MIIEDNKLKIIVFIKKLIFKIKDIVIFGRIVWEIVLFIKDIECKIIK